MKCNANFQRILRLLYLFKIPNENISVGFHGRLIYESIVHDFFYSPITGEHVSHNEHTLDVVLLH